MDRPLQNAFPGEESKRGYIYGNTPATEFPPQPNRQWQFSPGRADFGPDGSIDAIIQNTNTAQMTISLRYFDGINDRVTDPGSSVDYLLLGSGDINRDGRTDLLFEGCDPDYQWLAVWYLKEKNMVESHFLSPDHISQTWKIAAVADFDSDSKLDLLFQDYLGHAILWYMDGKEQKEENGTADLSPQPDFYERIVGTGDFNHDGKTDILFQLNKPNMSDDGNLIVWYMNGPTKIQNLQDYMLLDPPHPTDVKWRAVATADFDNDGNTDILFQKKEKDVNGNDIMGGVLMRWYLQDRSPAEPFGIKFKRLEEETSPPQGNVVGPR